jgi:hypothetical protein
MVHVSCCAAAGAATPVGSVVAKPGTRTVAVENTSGVNADVAPVTPAGLAPVAVNVECGRRLFASSNRCTQQTGHSGPCMGDADVTAAPVNDVDSVLAGRQAATVVPRTRQPDLVVPASAQERARVPMIDEPTDPAPEPEAEPFDPSVERFKRLMLD